MIVTGDSLARRNLARRHEQHRRLVPSHLPAEFISAAESISPAESNSSLAFAPPAPSPPPSPAASPQCSSRSYSGTTMADASPEPSSSTRLVARASTRLSTSATSHDFLSRTEPFVRSLGAVTRDQLVANRAIGGAAREEGRQGCLLVRTCEPGEAERGAVHHRVAWELEHRVDLLVIVGTGREEATCHVVRSHTGCPAVQDPSGRKPIRQPAIP